MNEQILQSCDEGSLDTLLMDDQITHSLSGMVEAVLEHRNV